MSRSLHIIPPRPIWLWHLQAARRMHFCRIQPWSAVNAVDKGQLEAALALGYTEKRAYRRVILPQAKKIYFPLLRNQFVLLLKETSVVGFISAMDLTHAGDVIRGRTLEAFFPLMTIAIVYFLMIWLFTFLINKGNKLLENRNAREAEKK